MASDGLVDTTRLSIGAATVGERPYALTPSFPTDNPQIELRLLAQMPEDPLMTEAFRHGEDMHTRTASEVLGVHPLMSPNRGISSPDTAEGDGLTPCNGVSHLCATAHQAAAGTPLPSAQVVRIGSFRV